MKAVSRTAQWVAAARALESERPDALFDDPYARSLAGSAGFEIIDRLNTPISNVYFAIRTAYLDRVVLEATADGPIRQVVLMAAGMDTRALRLPLPAGLTVYELDHTELLDIKEELLSGAAPAGGVTRVPVPVDLAEPWPEALKDAGFRPGCPTVWVTEGLLYYLPEDAAHRLLTESCALSGPGSLLTGDLLNQAAITDQKARPFIKGLAEGGSPWQFGVDRPEELLASHGWQPVDVIQPGEDGTGRWPLPVVPRDKPDAPTDFLFTARTTDPLPGPPRDT
ncbi:class I SAM-dependent methyltransferase [Streptomyces diacarni]|uniref:class I SAM-dependent methyltransferase n=1 Tax=Streptomyces diacarni TaxID=2800381 RepID=UPI0015F01415|nr:SAM-dependent methyltransferase [Streptomyces diacarni]